MLRRGSRLFVQQSRFDEVVEGVAEIAKSIRLGPGMDEATQMGPLVSDEQLRRVTVGSTKSLVAVPAAAGDGVRAVLPSGLQVAGHMLPPVAVDPDRAGPDLLGQRVGFGDVLGPDADAEAVVGVVGGGGDVVDRCWTTRLRRIPAVRGLQAVRGREMGHEVLEAYTEVKAVIAQL